MKSRNTESPESLPAELKRQIERALKDALDDFYVNPRFLNELCLPMPKERAVAIIKDIVFRAIDKPVETLEAAKQALDNGIAGLELKGSLPHGVLCGILDDLPLSEAERATALRQMNRDVELPKGWLGYRSQGLQRKITVGDYRHDPRLRKVLESGEIYTDMAACGSEGVFRRKFCPSGRKDSVQAKCLRCIGQLVRWSEDLDPGDLPEIHERLAQLCLAVGFVATHKNRSTVNADGAGITTAITATGAHRDDPRVKAKRPGLNGRRVRRKTAKSSSGQSEFQFNTKPGNGAKDVTKDESD
jgi:hypothetical protein